MSSIDSSQDTEDNNQAAPCLRPFRVEGCHRRRVQATAHAHQEASAASSDEGAGDEATTRRTASHFTAAWWCCVLLYLQSSCPDDLIVLEYLSTRFSKYLQVFFEKKKDSWPPSHRRIRFDVFTLSLLPHPARGVIWCLSLSTNGDHPQFSVSTNKATINVFNESLLAWLVRLSRTLCRRCPGMVRPVRYG